MALRIKRFWRKSFKVVLILFISSFVYLIICRWVIPPITITQLVDIVREHGIKRDYVSWDEISPSVKLAAMASEDQLFTKNSGFNWDRIDKSLNAKPTKRKTKRARGAAASTISQQTAKNVFLFQGSGVFRYVRKLPEFYFTKLIEWFWGKKRIMEVYLNTIEMGPGIYGIEAASQAYFHKHAKDLNNQEAALIIACLPNPKRFTVKPLSRWVAWKQQWILRQMNFIQGDSSIKQFLKQ